MKKTNKKKPAALEGWFPRTAAGPARAGQSWPVRFSGDWASWTDLPDCLKTMCLHWNLQIPTPLVPTSGPDLCTNLKVSRDWREDWVRGMKGGTHMEESGVLGRSKGWFICLPKNAMPFSKVPFRGPVPISSSQWFWNRIHFRTENGFCERNYKKSHFRF